MRTTSASLRRTVYASGATCVTMGVMSVKGWVACAVVLVFLLGLAAFDGSGDVQAPVGATSSSTVAAQMADPPPAPVPVQPAAVPGLRVAQVIDGDTFALEDGTKVRVLGIDSCEMSTPGGARAKADAQAALEGIGVTLTAEPGVDRDRYGRLLRYVQGFGNVDLGRYMVAQDHTGVYGGRNDANPAYVTELRGLDDGRNCAGVPAPTYNEYDNHGGDGNDGESRFCARRRWC